MNISMTRGGKLAAAAGGASTMRGKVAAVVTAWADGQPRWEPVPDETVISASLDVVVSPATRRAALKGLAEQGLLIQDANGRYYAA